MIWLLAAVGLLLTAFGATAGAALVSVSRIELAEMVSLRLRGGRGQLSHMGRIEELLTAASATTSLGVVMLGVVVPAAVSGSGLGPLALMTILLAIPAVVFGGYFFPRLLTEPRAALMAKWVAPVLEIWAAPLWWVLPSHKPSRLDDLRSLWREGAAVGITEDEQLLQVENVINFAGRPVQQVMTPRTDVVVVSEDADLADIRIVFSPAGTAATCCWTCGASAGTWRSCWTSSVVRWASPRWRICSRNWSVRSSTNTIAKKSKPPTLARESSRPTALPIRP